MWTNYKKKIQKYRITTKFNYKIYNSKWNLDFQYRASALPKCSTLNRHMLQFQRIFCNKQRKLLNFWHFHLTNKSWYLCTCILKNYHGSIFNKDLSLQKSQFIYNAKCNKILKKTKNIIHNISICFKEQIRLDSC